jgi:hypothetical protein
MNGWAWLTQPQTPATWGFIGRVLLKAGGLFILLNVLFALLRPLPVIGQWSVYGWLVPYRERLPYGETPLANNLSLNSLEAMFATHALNRPKAGDEFRVLVVGDSGTWGIQLQPQETTTGALNALGLRLGDGRRVVAYNVGHPIMSATKDLMLLEYARRYQPDLVLWLVTLESFPLERQLEPPIVQNNAPRVRALINGLGLPLASDDPRLLTRSFLEETLFGQRRALADWLRLQMFGLAWATTGIDQVYPPYSPPTNDFDDSKAWQTLTGDRPLERADLALDVLNAGARLLGSVPLVVVNEPIFIADGTNSDLRYNLWYPRWAYDDYRMLLLEEASGGTWDYIDAWGIVPKEEFTDSPVHLSVQGTRLLVSALADYFINLGVSYAHRQP